MTTTDATIRGGIVARINRTMRWTRRWAIRTAFNSPGYSAFCHVVSGVYTAVWDAHQTEQHDYWAGVQQRFSPDLLTPGDLRRAADWLEAYQGRNKEWVSVNRGCLD